jgi:hypothetical protein
VRLHLRMVCVVVIVSVAGAVIGYGALASASTPWNDSSHCNEGIGAGGGVAIHSMGGINRSCRAPVTPTPCTGTCYHGGASGVPNIFRSQGGTVQYCNWTCSYKWYNGSNGWFSASLTDSP